MKSAFYVTTEAVARLAKIHTLVTESSYLKVKMFEKIGKAASGFAFQRKCWRWIRPLRERFCREAKSPSVFAVALAAQCAIIRTSRRGVEQPGSSSGS